MILVCFDPDSGGLAMVHLPAKVVGSTTNNPKTCAKKTGQHMKDTNIDFKLFQGNFKPALVFRMSDRSFPSSIVTKQLSEFILFLLKVIAQLVEQVIQIIILFQNAKMVQIMPLISHSNRAFQALTSNQEKIFSGQSNTGSILPFPFFTNKI